MWQLRRAETDAEDVASQPAACPRGSAIGDNPIKRREEDALDRDPVVVSIAQELRSLDASEGYVVALIGPWGSGKTSLLNLLRLRLQEEPSLPVIDYNPWLFSNTEQLMESFFTELAAQLRVKEGRLGTIASEIEAYGELLTPLAVVPVAGSLIDRVRGAASAVRKFQERRGDSILSRKEKLAAELSKLESPIVVILDDIDRLQPSEIRDIFKLVRLAANFPNVIYILAFDRHVVEEALDDPNGRGRVYLEKIVQAAIDLPAIPEELLVTHVARALEGMLRDLPGMDRFDEDRWPDVLLDVIKPLIRNMRDVRRYAASARITLRSLGGQVELVDLLALEAVRVFLPDVFLKIASDRAAMTATRSFGSRTDDDHHAEAVQQVIEAARNQGAVVRTAITHLFPAALRHIGGSFYGREWESSWLKARRVAHADILRLYLERAYTSGMTAFTDAERVFGLLSERPALEQLFSTIDVERAEDVIAALENYEGEYPREAVPVGTIVLLNIMPTLPDRPRGMLALDARLVVSRVVLRLLRQLSTPEEVASVVKDALPEITTLSSRFQLLLLVGYVEGAGHKLIAQEVADEIEADFAAAVRSGLPADVSGEWDLLTTLYWAYRRWGAGPSTLDPNLSPDVHAQVLLTAESERRSTSGSGRVVRRKTRLRWDTLVELYGGEDSLRQAVESARISMQEGSRLATVVNLADKYLEGWRPAD
ncbi:P-loop NTPase fold protein [Micromonospora chalcea]|uniref:KAP family P-loop NTPase fold protein n=1 Tax=Micromonospora chalcea TaxID=1874 RepID=UPI0033D6E433